MSVEGNVFFLLIFFEIFNNKKRWRGDTSGGVVRDEAYFKLLLLFFLYKRKTPTFCVKEEEDVQDWTSSLSSRKALGCRDVLETTWEAVSVISFLASLGKRCT